MCILNQAMRDSFINSLRPRYARLLPAKLIENLDDISFGAVKLFNSGTPFRPPFSAESQVFIKEDSSCILQSTLSPIVEKVWTFFNKMTPPKNEIEFDEFHNELCELFLCIFKKYDYSYGNAQKFVNMLFKYLACYEDASRYADWFKYCHMALDGYTYHGQYKLPYYQDVIYNPACGKSLTAWSKLNKVDIRYKGYLEIISDIRSYIPNRAEAKTYNDYLEIGHSIGLFANIPPLELEDDYVLTPFEAEFFIWAICKACKKLPTAEVERVREAF